MRVIAIGHSVSDERVGTRVSVDCLYNQGRRSGCENGGARRSILFNEALVDGEFKDRCMLVHVDNLNIKNNDIVVKPLPL